MLAFAGIFLYEAAWLISFLCVEILDSRKKVCYILNTNSLNEDSMKRNSIKEIGFK